MEESPENKPFRFTFKTEDKNRLPYVIDIDTDVKSILILLHSLVELAKTDKNTKQIFDSVTIAIVRYCLKTGLGGNNNGPANSKNPFSGIFGPFSSANIKPPPGSGFSEMRLNDIATVNKIIEEMLSGNSSGKREPVLDPDDLFRDDKAEPDNNRKDKSKEKLTD